MKYAILVIFLSLSFSGCFPHETARLMGVGVKPFKVKGKVYSQNFEEDIFDCYYQIKEIIKGSEAIIYRGSPNKGFIISFGYTDIFPSASHSTEVAVFFNWLDENKTEIEVSSLNHNLAKFISEKIFKKLNDSFSSGKK